MNPQPTRHKPSRSRRRRKKKWYCATPGKQHLLETKPRRNRVAFWTMPARLVLLAALAWAIWHFTSTKTPVSETEVEQPTPQRTGVVVPKKSKRMPDKISWDSLIREQETLAADVELFATEFCATLDSGTANWIRQHRMLHGDATLLEQLPDWLQQDAPDYQLPAAWQQRFTQLQQRHTVLNRKLADLTSALSK